MNRRQFLSAAAMMAAGCTVSRGVSLPAPGGVSVPDRIIGLNGSYHGALDAATLAHMHTWRGVTLRAPVENVAQAQAIAESIAPYSNIHAVFLVETMWNGMLPNLAAVPSVGIELGNELDLAGVPADVFGRWVVHGYETLVDAGYTGQVISGGIYCVEPHALDYLRTAGIALWPNGVTMGVHRYGDPTYGQAGYGSRQEESNALVALAAGRPIAVTEFGYHTVTPQDETQALMAAQQDIEWFQSIGADCYYYQYTDGTDNTDLDHYGVRAADGRWKPVEGIFA